MKTRTISVITVTLNACRELQKTLASIASQDYPDLEIIVIDGGSKDETLDVIRKFEDRISYWVSEHDHGIYHAMNKGIPHAHGEWILFLNAGDVLKNANVISTLFSHNYSAADVIFGDSVADYLDFRVFQKAQSLDELWKGMPFSHQAMFTRTSMLKVQGFSEEFDIAADFELVYRLYSEKRKFLYVPGVISVFEVYGISSREPMKSLKERYAICRRYSTTPMKQKLFYVLLYVIFLITWLGYMVLPAKLMQWILKLRHHKNIIR